MNNKQQLGQYLPCIEKFKHKKILVVGDLMLDKFVHGTVARISPEAPVPVLDVVKEIDLPGGAGNVVNNISKLGAEVLLVSVVGDDQAGRHLVSNFENARSGRIDTSGILIEKERPTTIKTRIIAQHQQIVRVDRESKKEISLNLVRKITELLKKAAGEADAVLISDYGKGVIIPPVLTAAIEFSRKRNIPVVVDPKIEHFLSYKKVTCITPNLHEAVFGMRLLKAESEKEIEELGKKILHQLECDSVIITRGEKGMSIFEKNRKPVRIPTRAKEVFDVTGAGDTVVSVLALCVASGSTLRMSAEIANYAAGIVVGKLGTATVTAEELLNAIR